MKWKIVVDSSCDLRELEALNVDNSQNIGFDVVPLKLIIGDNEFVDVKGLDTAQLIHTMESHNGKTSSSAPNVGEWKEAFSDADNVIAVTITSNLSGSNANAQMAKKLLEEEGHKKNIKIIDSLSAGPELTLLLEKVVEFINKGFSFEDVAAKGEKYIANTRLLYVLESLDNLIKNGRVGKFEGGIAGLLGIRILGTASEVGTLELMNKVRGQKKVYDLLVEKMEECGFNGGRVIINNCMNEKWAEYIKDKIKEKFASCKITIMPAGGLCSYYAQKNGVMVAFETAANIGM